MIRYFRINDPYRLVGLFVLLVILYLPLFLTDHEITIPELKSLLLAEKLNEGNRMYKEVVDNSGPLAAWVHEAMDSIFGRSMLARHIVALVIIFLQSAYVGILFIAKKTFSENTYIPSLLFALLFFFSPDTIAFTNELLGSGLLLLALQGLFQEIEFRNESDEAAFTVGLCISLASLFSFAFSVYLPCAALVLLLFTRNSTRKLLLLIFGFLMPHLFVISLAFLHDSTSDLWQFYYLSNLSFGGTAFASVKTLLTLAGLPLAYLLISVIMLNREARFSKYQSQIMQVMLLWLAFSFLFVFYTKGLRPQSLIVFIPVLSFLLTHFFLLIRRKKFIHLNFWVLFVGIVAMAYLSRFEKIPSTDFRRLWVTQGAADVQGKKILVLGNAPDLYLHNALATPFLNWDLSSGIFREPGYYEHVTRVYHAFKNDPPDLVIDRENLLKGFLSRMPGIESSYEHHGDRYIRKVSN